MMPMLRVSSVVDAHATLYCYHVAPPVSPQARHASGIHFCQCPAPLSALPPQVRQESGINSFADVAKLLEGAPRPLLDTLRLGAVVRHSGAQ